MNLNKFFSNIIVNEKKVIYLIFFLPIALFVGSTVSNLVVFLIIFIFIYEIFKKKKTNFLFNKEFIIFIILYLYLILNSIFLTENLESITRAVGFIRFPILAYAIAFYCSIENNKYQNKILNFWFLLFCIVTIDILFEFTVGFNLTGFKSTYPGRIASFAGSELRIGGYYFGFVLLAILYAKQNLEKYTYFFIILFLITSLLIGERANFLKVFLGVSIFIFFLEKKSLFKKITFIAGLIIFIFLTIKMIPSYYKSRYVDQIYHSINKNDVKSLVKSNKHLGHYYTAIEIFKKNIFFGIGIKNFRNVSHNKKYNPIEDFNGGTTHPHQLHFELLSELGITGYLLLLGMLIYFIKKGIKIYFKNKNFLSLCSSIFILTTIVPLIPSGSFFTSHTATIFWINLAFLLRKNI